MEDKLEREEGIHKVIEYSHADSRPDMDSFSNSKIQERIRKAVLYQTF